jgi:NDP-sugar pyrophosphorylase family protein
MIGFNKKDFSVVDATCSVGEKVGFKFCSIAKDCQIGKNSKLTNCVVMSGVSIGER